MTFTINPTFLPTEYTGPYRPFSKWNSSVYSRNRYRLQWSCGHR